MGQSLRRLLAIWIDAGRIVKRVAGRFGMKLLREVAGTEFRNIFRPGRRLMSEGSGRRQQ
jgi:hypothetical protein